MNSRNGSMRRLRDVHYSMVVLMLVAPHVFAQSENPVHDELRTLRDEAMKAFDDRDIDALLEHVHTDVVVTWQNSEVSRGHDGVKDFYNRMMSGDASEVESVSAELEVDELSLLHGDDTAIAFGSLDESFSLRSGLAFDLDNRWTATLVREDDQWLIAAFHVSTNMFDNGLMDVFLWWNSIKVGAIAVLAGLIVGVIVMLIFRRSRSRQQNATE